MVQELSANKIENKRVGKDIKPIKSRGLYNFHSIDERIYREKQWGFTGSLKASRVPVEMKKIKFSEMKVHGKNIYTKGKMGIILYNDKKKRTRNDHLSFVAFLELSIIVDI